MFGHGGYHTTGWHCTGTDRKHAVPLSSYANRSGTPSVPPRRRNPEPRPKFIPTFPPSWGHRRLKIDHRATSIPVCLWVGMLTHAPELRVNRTTAALARCRWNGTSRQGLARIRTTPIQIYPGNNLYGARHVSHALWASAPTPQGRLDRQRSSKKLRIVLYSIQLAG